MFGVFLILRQSGESGLPAGGIKSQAEPALRLARKRHGNFPPSVAFIRTFSYTFFGGISFGIAASLLPGSGG